jgi:hypothetical protein
MDGIRTRGTIVVDTIDKPIINDIPIILQYTNGYFEEDIVKYIDKNEKKPTISNKDNEIKKLGRWINLQQANYKKRKKVFIDDNIFYEWSQFMKDYQQYVLNTCNICGKKDHKTINCLQFFNN